MKKYILALAFALALCSVSVAAELAIPLPAHNSYITNRNLNMGFSGDDFTVRARESIRNSRYGRQGLNNIFKNFSDGHNIDWNLAGVKKNFNLIGSVNKNQSKGAVRTHLFATAVHNSPGMQLLAVDEPVRAYGSKQIITDKDIVARDVLSGRRIRFEVKDVSPASQVRNFPKYKAQLDKMAAEYRRTGEKPIWINRREVHPAIAGYAKKLGISVEGNVTTSQDEKVLLKNRNINSVLEKYSTTVQVQHIARLGMGVYGAYMLVRTSPFIYSAWEEFFGNKNREEVDYLRISQLSAQFGAGAIFTVRGLSSTAGSLFKTPVAQSLAGRLPLAGMGRFAGGVGVALILADYGIDAVSYWRGHMSAREFAYASSTKLGGLAGALGGAWVGGKIGASLGGALGAVGGPLAAPGAAIGGTVGSIAGGFIGYLGASNLGGYAVGQYYEFQNNASQTEHLEYLITHYQSEMRRL